MAVLKLKSYKFQYLIRKDGYTDEMGDYVEGSCEWSETLDCDIVQTNGIATPVKYEDGVAVQYSYIAYLSKKAPILNYGDSVRIMKDEAIIVSSTVKGFMQYQYQTKVWL